MPKAEEMVASTEVASTEKAEKLFSTEEIRALDSAGRARYFEFMKVYISALKSFSSDERQAEAKALTRLDVQILAALQPVLDKADGDLGHRPFTVRHGDTGYTVVRSGAKRAGGGTGAPRGPRHPIQVTQPIKNGKTPVGTQFRSYAAWAQAEGLKTGVGINAKGLILKKGGAAKDVV